MRKYYTLIPILCIWANNMHGQLDSTKLSLDTLDNGMKVVVYADSSFHTVASKMVFYAGSKYDRADQSGVAYLCSKLMESELTAAQNLKTDLQNPNYLTGGFEACNINHDISSFSQVFIPSQLKTALALEAKRLDPNNFSNKNINRWRDVLIERQINLQSAGLNRTFDLNFLNQLLPPYYAKPVDGFSDLVASSTNDEIRDFIKQYYAPNRAVLTVVGPVSRDSVIKFSNAFFRFWNLSDNQRFILREQDTLGRTLKNDTLLNDVLFPFQLVSLVFPMVSPIDSGFISLEPIADLLLNDQYGLISRGLQPWVLETIYNYQPLIEKTQIIYSMIPKPGVSIDTMLARFDTLMHTLSEKGINEPLFSNWQNKTLFDFLTQLGKPEFIAGQFSEAVILGKHPLQWTALKKHILELDRSNMNKLVKQHFVDANKMKILLLSEGVKR